MEDEPEVATTPDYTFDFDTLPIGTLTSVHQEGNYIVGLTSTGTSFRQHIPVGKILNKKDGEWVLQDTVLR